MPAERPPVFSLVMSYFTKQGKFSVHYHQRIHSVISCRSSHGSPSLPTGLVLQLNGAGNTSSKLNVCLSPPQLFHIGICVMLSGCSGHFLGDNRFPDGSKRNSRQLEVLDAKGYANDGEEAQ